MWRWIVQQKISLIVITVGFAGIYTYAEYKWLHTKEPTSEGADLFIPPPIPVMKYFTFGYNDVLADLYWLRLIQNMEHCGQPKHNKYLAPDGRRMGRNRTPECNMGWSYQMLDYITDIAPENYTPHLYGPMNLSVIVDDIAGATALFDKSLKNFPKDWMIAFNTGYHYMVELEDLATAADYFHRAGQLGAPEWVLVLAARLNNKVGRDQIAKSILQSYLKNENLNETVRERAEKKLAEIEGGPSK
jgi:hypothetical protein